MYRHFRHKHPEHVSKRRQKKSDTSDSVSKQIDDTLNSVVGTSPIPNISYMNVMKHEEPASETEEEDNEIPMATEKGLSEFSESTAEPRDIPPADGEKEGSNSRDELSSNTSESKHRINSYSMSPHVHACNECGRKFPWQSSLERHMYTHTGQKPYSCRWCSLKFSIKSNCERHCLRIHGKSFNNPRKERRNQGKPFKCPVCDECFAFKINCERHCLDTHKQHYDAMVLSDGDAVNADMEEPGMDVQTNGLVMRPRTKKTRRNKKTPITSRPSLYYQCLNCELSFESKKDLEYHEENNHPNEEDADMEGHEDTNSSFSGSLVVDA